MPLSGAVLRDALSTAGAHREHVREVRRLATAPWADPAAMDALRLARLAATVSRARRRSPYYRELLSGLPPLAGSSFEVLGSLPVTGKSDIRTSGLDRCVPAVVSRPQLRTTWRTSGSSGQPYTYGVDLGYLHRHRAQRAFVYLAAGLAAGDSVVELVPGDGLAAPSRWSYPTFRRTAVGYLRHDVLAIVRAARPRLLYGNRSHLLDVLDEVASSGLPLHVPYVCSSSETLHPADERRLAEVLGARVLEVYGSAEAGNLAHRPPGASTWTVLEPRVVVEVLDAHRRPVAPGEVGEVVVTTLTEPTSPLLRYATGDLVRVERGSSDGGSGLVLAALEGRSTDTLLDVDGRPVSFWRIASAAFWASDVMTQHVSAWQVHQRADGAVVVTVSLTDAGDLVLVRRLVQEHLRRLLGDNAPVDVVAGDARSGQQHKFRAVTREAVGTG